MQHSQDGRSAAQAIGCHVRKATTKIRSRRCGAPTSRAEMPSAAVRYPRSCRLRRTAHSHLAFPDATFSTIATVGRNAATARQYSHQRPERAPSRPAPLPALLTSWQGKPPARTSTGGRTRGVTARTSAMLLSTWGQCFASTARQKAFCSTCQIVRPRPDRSSPSSRPPMPEKRDPIFTLRTCARG